MDDVAGRGPVTWAHTVHGRTQYLGTHSTWAYTVLGHTQYMGVHSAWAHSTWAHNTWAHTVQGGMTTLHAHWKFNCQDQSAAFEQCPYKHGPAVGSFMTSPWSGCPLCGPSTSDFNVDLFFFPFIFDDPPFLLLVFLSNSSLFVHFRQLSLSFFISKSLPLSRQEEE